MPRVIYSTTSSSGEWWIEAAKTMYSQHSWQPVLFIGNPYVTEAAKEIFPEIYTQEPGLLSYGFPIEATIGKAEQSFDTDLWMEYQSHLHIIFDQMTCFGPPEAMTASQRQHHARNLFCDCNAIIDKLSPDIIVFAEVPSRPFYYTLHFCAKKRGVKIVFFVPTISPELTLMQEDITELALRVQEKIETVSNTSEEEKDKRFPVSTSLQKKIDNLVLSEDFDHWYMKKDETSDIVNDSECSVQSITEIKRIQIKRFRPWKIPLYIFNLIKLLILILHNKIQSAINSIHAKKTAQEKQEKEVIEDLAYNREEVSRKAVGTKAEYLDKVTDGTLYGLLSSRLVIYNNPSSGSRSTTSLDFLKHMAELHDNEFNLKRNLISKELRSFYSSISFAPDLGKKYIYFPLHMRPEATSNPNGGNYYDPLLSLTVMHNALPEDWKIYVKEHISQFADFSFAHCGRTIQDYLEMNHFENVVLIDADFSSKQLILNSKAVVTTTGTAGFEAAINGKLALYFGEPWYRTCPGTIQARSVPQVNEILLNAENYIASEKQLNDWYRALSAASFPFVYDSAYANLPEPKPTTHNEQACYLTDALMWWHENRFA